MPAIADPYRARPYVERADTIRDHDPERRTYSLRIRIRTALHRDELTRALAEGLDPNRRAELSLRAAQITGARSRRTLARAMRRTIAEAHKPPMTRSRIVITDRRAVLDAEDTIQAMINRLTSREPVRAEGMAIAERILTNAERSPLHNPSEPGSLRRAITHATAALDTSPQRSHELSDRSVTPQPLSHPSGGSASAHPPDKVERRTTTFFAASSTTARPR